MTAAANLDWNVADPFTRVLNAIWKVLEDHEPLARHVSAGNRIKRVGGGDGVSPVKSGLHHGDLPELDVISEGGQVDQKGSLVQIVHSWAIALKTDSPYMNDQTFPVYWELIRAFVMSDCKIGLPGLVDTARLGNYTTDEQLERAALTGWLTLLTIETRMTLDKASITT